MKAIKLFAVLLMSLLFVGCENNNNDNDNDKKFWRYRKALTLTNMPLEYLLKMLIALEMN